MLVELFSGVLALVFIYLIIGVVVAGVTGGRDPLSFASWPVAVFWPPVVIVVVVGLLMMPDIDEGEKA